MGSVKVKLKPVTRTLTKGKRVSITVTLPPAARLALAAGRPVTVRLSVRTKVGTRVVTVRRTVRIARHGDSCRPRLDGSNASVARGTAERHSVHEQEDGDGGDDEGEGASEGTLRQALGGERAAQGATVEPARAA